MSTLSREKRKQIKKQRDYVLELMSQPKLNQDDWNDLNKRVQVYNEMLKSSIKINPDVIVSGMFQLFGVMLVLIGGQITFVDRNALSFVPKGRV